MSSTKTWWVFGNTSEYAKHIIGHLTSHGHEIVETFNRSNTDYSDPASFLEKIKNKTLPDRIFFNANIQHPDFDYNTLIIDQKDLYDEWVANWQLGFWFKLNLVKYLEHKMKGVFIFSSSSIALEQQQHRDCILYRILRASEQQLMYSIGGSQTPLTVCGACIGNMEDDTKQHYAELIANHMIEDKFQKNGIYSVSTAKGIPEVKFKNPGVPYTYE
jgi:hypothetical protein